MNETAPDVGGPQASEAARPVGMVRPPSDQTARALTAIETDRLEAAARLIAQLPIETKLDVAWRWHIEGLLAVARKDHDTPERLFTKASAVALEVASTDENGVDADALRLAASALEQIGRIHRRRDHPDSAYRAHRAAFALRDAHGACEEVWETAVSLAIDAHLAGRHDSARRWLGVAIDLGRRCSEQPDRRQAVALTKLTTCHIECNRFADAIDTARRARTHFQSHDPGAVSAPRSELHLGHALLKQGEALHATNPEQSKATLGEALECLSCAHESLLAFGPDATDDARWCAEQKDFAARLIASLDV